MSALALQHFGFEDRLVRVADRDGAPWFVAQDVCACLELVNSRKAIETLDADEKGVTISDTLGGPQQMAIISESGLYALIFKSRKAAAVRFRKWVTAEVLPAIRKTGGYHMPSNDADVLPMLADADALQRTSVALSMVREARQTFGRQTARRIWLECGLPRVVGPAGSDAPDDIPQSVREWFDRCVGVHPDSRTGATALFNDYRAFCSMTEQAALDQNRFGRALTSMGFLPCRGGGNGRMARAGLYLKE